MEGKKKIQIFKAGEIKGYHDDSKYVDFVSKKICDDNYSVFLPVVLENFGLEYNYGEDDKKGSIKVIASPKLNFYAISTYPILLQYSTRSTNLGTMTYHTPRKVVSYIYLENSRNGLREISLDGEIDKIILSRKLLGYFVGCTPIVNRINREEIEFTPESIEKLVLEYLSIKETDSRKKQLLQRLWR